MLNIKEGKELVTTQVRKQHMSMVTYAPDMVKWTKKDIKKLLAEKKPAEWTQTFLRKILKTNRALYLL